MQVQINQWWHKKTIESERNKEEERERESIKGYKSVINIIQINLRPDHVMKYILMNEAQSSCNTHTKLQPRKPQKLWHLQR